LYYSKLNGLEGRQGVAIIEFGGLPIVGSAYFEMRTLGLGMQADVADTWAPVDLSQDGAIDNNEPSKSSDW
jgi:hypothetical protein